MLGQVLGALNVVLFRLGNDQVTAAELFGFVTGAASVWLTVLARISNFPVGIANSGFFLVDLTALVYVLFLGLCAAGVSGWRKALRAGHEASVPATAVKVGGA
jgi:nicotinamide mononucleotide transporter